VSTNPQATVAHARDEFLALVETIRPELHRYCARLTGSVIDGEDIVQDTLARAFYALGLDPDPPPLRPWLFRIAHNAALDHLKRHGNRYTEPRADLGDVVDPAEADRVDHPDPFTARVALARFLALPVLQRSAVILKDVLGHTLEDTAETMDTTVLAVKAALVRGRRTLREPGEPGEHRERAAPDRAELDRYAALFNARDWDGLRALVGEDCRLDLVGKSHRRGKNVRMYFDQYAKQDLVLDVVVLDGVPVLAARAPGAERPAYFITLAWHDGRVDHIRDFRYVPYIAADAA
jgi:RNA polymerase sigma factor (sigma-70 family)